MNDLKISANGFIMCPKCGRKTKVKVNDDTALVNFPLFCERCKRESVITFYKKKEKTELSVTINAEEFSKMSEEQRKKFAKKIGFDLADRYKQMQDIKFIEEMFKTS